MPGGVKIYDAPGVALGDRQNAVPIGFLRPRSPRNSSCRRDCPSSGAVSSSARRDARHELQRHEKALQSLAHVFAGRGRPSPFLSYHGHSGPAIAFSTSHHNQGGEMGISHGRDSFADGNRWRQVRPSQLRPRPLSPTLFIPIDPGDAHEPAPVRDPVIGPAVGHHRPGPGASPPPSRRGHPSFHPHSSTAKALGNETGRPTLVLDPDTPIGSLVGMSSGLSAGRRFWSAARLEDGSPAAILDIVLTRWLLDHNRCDP